MMAEAIDLTTSSAVEAAALARFHDWARRQGIDAAEQVDRATVQDAYLAGFVRGGGWALRTSAALSDPAFRRAVAVLAELCARENKS